MAAINLMGSPDQSSRILVVGMRWPPETFLMQLLVGLSRRGFEVTIAGWSRPSDPMLRRLGFQWLAAPPWSGPISWRLLRLAAALGLSIVRSKDDSAALVRHAWREPNLRRKLEQLARLTPYSGRRWDLIYFPWNNAAVTMSPLFNMGTPVIVSCRGSQLKIAPHNPDRPAIRDALGETFRRAAVVHCVSRDVLREAKALGLDPAMAHVITPAVDTKFFRPPEGAAAPDGPELRVVVTGRLVWVKGHEYALRAVARLHAAGIPVRLEVIGDVPERQRLNYTAGDLGIAGLVRFHGHLTPASLREVAQSSDVFLVSSFSEGFMNAALEAMSCGLPVVTTDCGGIREAVTDGVEGLIVPVREPGPMAGALARLASDPALRRRMGLAARARVEREFDLEQQLERWAELCRQTIAEWQVRG
jgi:glycosyltransferase involved in cell wall biosynthesis